MDRLYARSEGNPLYTEELLAAGPDGRGTLPASLAAALAVRIERLGPDAQDVVRVLSAAGELEHEALVAVAGLEPRALNEALREAVSSHIVQTGPADRYLFRHALLREAVYDDLLPGERGELHRALAAALERPAAGGAPAGAQRAARIAHHYLNAGDQPAALAAAVRAGTAAMDVQAYEEGAQLFERALELWSRVPDAEALVGEDEAEVLERAATCHLYADDLSRAEALARRALARSTPPWSRAAARACTGCSPARSGPRCARTTPWRRCSARSTSSPATGRAASGSGSSRSGPSA